MTTNKRLRLQPAIARLDSKPRKQTKQERLRQRRQVAAWQRKVGEQKRD